MTARRPSGRLLGLLGLSFGTSIAVAWLWPEYAAVTISTILLPLLGWVVRRLDAVEGAQRKTTGMVEALRRDPEPPEEPPDEDDTKVDPPRGDIVLSLLFSMGLGTIVFCGGYHLGLWFATRGR